jgi:UDP-N-acetylmuramate: L-alanyl-gamma-D-glutamyl-meso-diaminopimelate ligase
MLAWILESNNKNPGFLVGGVPLNFGASARLGNGDGTSAKQLFVIEADEYDTAFFDKRSKFLHYRPKTVILNNLEFDHADIFDSLADIERQFCYLLRTVPSSGRAIINGLEESLERVVRQGCWSEVRTFGAANSDFYCTGTPDKFEVFEHGKSHGTLHWELTGVHNMHNALAAIAAAKHVGVPIIDAISALKNFKNVKRRLEKKASILLKNERDPVTIWDDFAHHPTAIRTTVDGLSKKIGPKNRIIAIFEPRSNTMKLGSMKEQLPWSLENADLAFCHSKGLDWDAKQVLNSMGNRAIVSDAIDVLISKIVETVRAGDQILCMSNGGFDYIHEKLATAIGDIGA